MLDTQYRMHPMISAFPSKKFYDSRIKDGFIEPKDSKFNKITRRNIFINVYQSFEEYINKSFVNFVEIEIILEILKMINKHLGNKISIGIISAYRVQVEYIKSYLNKDK